MSELREIRVPAPGEETFANRGGRLALAVCEEIGFWAVLRLFRIKEIFLVLPIQ